MKAIRFLATATLAAGLFAPASFADGRNPGSVLIYPMHRSGLGQTGEFFTVVNVTNANTSPFIPGITLGGSTNVQFEYVNVVPNAQNPFLPLSCIVIDRVEMLTPADTLSVLTSCHNASGGQEGYLVVSAQDPFLFKSPWSFNYLMGSEMVITDVGGLFSLNAIPFSSPQSEGAGTDLDGDGQLDFDGVEYEGVPDTLYIDSFLGVADASLALINLTGGVDFYATVRFDAWNDNEYPLSASLTFKCWFEEPLSNIALFFTQGFLANNTPDDPQELDINCDGRGDVETGWAMINGVVASSNVESQPDPAILGAITSGPTPFFDGGRPLWESADKQLNGDFLKYGGNDPEN